MFEVVIRRTGLSVTIANEPSFQPGTQDPFKCAVNMDLDSSGGTDVGVDLGSAEIANDFSMGLLNEIGLDLPFYPLDAPGGLANGENMFQEFLSVYQWNMSS
jgi:hypothetical protein